MTTFGENFLWLLAESFDHLFYIEIIYLSIAINIGWDQ